MVRLLRVFPELLIMIKGMWSAARSVFFTLFLLAIITYVFAIMFKQLAETNLSETRKDEYFKDVFASFYTLVMTGTFLDDLKIVTTSIGNDPQSGSALLAVLLLVFVLLAALTVLNMLIGVLCEVVSGVSATEI